MLRGGCTLLAILDGGVPESHPCSRGHRSSLLGEVAEGHREGGGLLYSDAIHRLLSRGSGVPIFFALDIPAIFIFLLFLQLLGSHRVKVELRVSVIGVAGAGVVARIVVIRMVDNGGECGFEPFGGRDLCLRTIPFALWTGDSGGRRVLFEIEGVAVEVEIAVREVGEVRFGVAVRIDILLST